MSEDKNLQFLRDVMTTAVEGGINHWAEVRRLDRDAELNVLRFECRDYDDSTAEWKEINHDNICAAIEKIMLPEGSEGSVKVADYIRRDVRKGYLEADAGDIDADAADVIVQVAAFGEIVFS